MNGSYLLAQVTGVRDVRARLHERGIGRHAVAIRAVMFGDDRADRRIHVALPIDPRLGLQVRRLENLVGFMIAVAGIDAADDRELVQHRRLLRQMLADHHARQLRLRHAEGPAIFERLIRLRVPRIDVARPARHPEKNDALAARRGASCLSRLAAGPQQIGKRQPGQSRQAGFQHAAAAGDDQSLPRSRVEIAKRVLTTMVVAGVTEHGSAISERSGNVQLVHTLYGRSTCAKRRRSSHPQI